MPDSKITSLRRRGRQEEAVEGVASGAVEALSEAGPAANVGQILQGVLGADLRPIFAGSTAFIPEGDFRDGVTAVLQQTIAPAIQTLLSEFGKNVQRHFNSTTPQPNTLNNTNNINQNQAQQLQQQNFNQFQQQQFGQFQPNNNINQFQQVGLPQNNQFQQQNFQPNLNNQFQQQNPFLTGQTQFQPNNNLNQFQPNLNQFQSNHLNQFQPANNLNQFQPNNNINNNNLNQFQPNNNNNLNQFQQNHNLNQFQPSHNNQNQFQPSNNLNQFQPNSQNLLQSAILHQLLSNHRQNQLLQNQIQPSNAQQHGFTPNQNQLPQSVQKPNFNNFQLPAFNNKFQSPQKDVSQQNLQRHSIDENKPNRNISPVVPHSPSSANDEEV